MEEELTSKLKKKSFLWDLYFTIIKITIMFTCIKVFHIMDATLLSGRIIGLIFLPWVFQVVFNIFTNKYDL